MLSHSDSAWIPAFHGNDVHLRSQDVTNKKIDTQLIHSDYVPPAGFSAYPPAIHHASTVLFKDVASSRSSNWKDKTAYTYGLHGTPTSFTLEARLAAIEGGSHCLLAPSGLAAIAMVDLALLRTGDDVLLPENVYTRTANWAAGSRPISASRRATTIRWSAPASPNDPGRTRN
jgi:cystathionine beta-lyase